MVRVIFTNNADVKERIVDEAKPVRVIMDAEGFTYGNATLNIQGRAINPEYLDNPLSGFINAGTTEVRITAVPHKANA